MISFERLFMSLVLLLLTGLLSASSVAPMALVLCVYFAAAALPAAVREWANRKTSAEDLEALLNLIENPEEHHETVE